MLVATCLASCVVAGFLPGFFRPVHFFLKAKLGLSEESAARLPFWFALYSIPFLPAAGWLVDQWGLNEVLFVGCLGQALGVSWLGMCRSYASLLWGLLGLAFACACTLTAAVALMPHALALGTGTSSGFAFALGFTVLGVAALIAPLLISWLGNRFDFRNVLLCAGLSCLLPALFLILTPKSEFPDTAPAAPLQESFADPRLWILALVTFLYFPLEHSLEVWPRPYLAETGHGSSGMGRLLLLFWLGFFAMRIVFGWIVGPGYEAWMILTLLVTSFMILGNLVGAYGASSGYYGVWFVGACYGPLLPLLFGVLFDLEVARGIPGLAIGGLLALAAVSALTIQSWLVLYARSHTARASMRIPMILALVMAAPVLVLALIRHAR